jgi:hypothetical protein
MLSKNSTTNRTKMPPTHTKRKKCPAGKFLQGKNSSRFAVRCGACPRGYYGNISSQIRCFKCAAGRFGSQSALSDSNCSALCTAGKFSREAAIGCTLCNPGRYGHIDGSGVSCAGVCQRGRFSTAGSTGDRLNTVCQIGLNVPKDIKCNLNHPH